MNRTLGLLIFCAVALSACGANAAGSAAKPSPSPSQRVRNGAQGELVQKNPDNLVLNTASGDVTVSYAAATTITKTSTAAFADITVGKCILATGRKDATGVLTASTVRLSDKVGGVCAQGAGPGGPGGPGANPARSPRPDSSPGAGARRLDFAGGEVTAVNGTTLTVQSPSNGPQTVTVATTVPVSRSAAATAADLAPHQCIAANGPRDASGKIAARAIQIVPAGPSGCFTGGRGGGGFGGFGGGRGNGGGPPGAPPGGPPGD